MRPNILLAVAMFAAVSLATSACAQVEIDVFILAGQSNMSGYGDVTQLASPHDTPQSDVMFWWGAALQEIQPGTTYTAANHYRWHHLQPGRGIRGLPHFGPELSFGRTLADGFPDRKIAVIKHALGGTNLAYDWNPEFNTQRTYAMYDLFKGEVHAAVHALVDAGFTPQIRAMCWKQGENDASSEDTFNAGDAGSYDANLQTFIAAVRAEFDAPEMQFIVGRLQDELPNAPGLNTVRQAQVNVGENFPNTDWLDTDDLPLLGDKTHYSNAGLIALGERFADAYLVTVPEPAGILLIGLASCMICLGRRRS